MRKVYLIVAIMVIPFCLFAQPSGWKSLGIGGGGALFNPSISPWNPMDCYLACDMSDMFNSTNGGRNWDVVPFQQYSSSPLSCIRFSADSNLRYGINIGFKTSAQTPMRSKDGGKTWKKFKVDPSKDAAYYLYSDIHSDKRIVLADYTHIFFTNDSGYTWKSIYTNTGADGGTIAGVYFDNTRIYIAAAKTLIVSSDGGNSFTPTSLTGIPTTEGIVSFSGGKSGGKLRFFCVTISLANIFPGITGADHGGYKNLYSLDDAKGSWKALSSKLPSGVEPFFVGMPENSITTAYVAGGNGSTNNPTIYKTTDGGISWNAVFKTTGNVNINTGWSGSGGDKDWYFGEYALGFSVSATDSNYLIMSDLGFAHGSRDGGKTWQQLYVTSAGENAMNNNTPKYKNYTGNGLENTACWWLHWMDSLHIISGFTDITAIRTDNGGISWSRNFTGLNYNSLYHIVQPAGSTTLYGALSSVHDMYQSTYLQDSRIDNGKGAIAFSRDSGHTWQIMHDFVHPVIWLALDPARPNRMYASVIHSTSGGIFVSNDINKGATSTWTKLTNPPGTEGHPFNIVVLKDGNLLCTYSGRRDASGKFTASSGLFMSTDGGSSWKDVSATGMKYWTMDVTIDPNDTSQNTWYAGVYSGWGGPANGLGGVYKTTDRGKNWNRILNLDHVSSVAIPAGLDSVMYICTESDGLYYTGNLQSGSPVFQQVGTYPFQHPSRVFFQKGGNEVWVASFGNGIRKGSTVYTSIPSSNNIYIKSTMNVYPNPVSSDLNIVLQMNKSSFLNFILVDMKGTTLKEWPGEKILEGKSILKLNLPELAHGMYLLKANGAGEEIVVRLSK